MVDIPFDTKELCIDQQAKIPLCVATKIWKYHIIPMIIVRALLGAAIWASKFSGYRSRAHELAKGRSGDSQHTFTGKGAVDWTCKESLLPKLLKLIIQYTDYTRIAVYDGFIHCDYKADDGYRYIFTSTAESDWTLKDTIKI